MRWTMMMKHRPLILAALLLAGCTTPSFVSPVAVTRFTAPSADFAAGKTIAIVPATGTDAGSPEFAAYARYIGNELESLGFSLVSPSSARLTAVLSLAHSVRIPEPRRGPISIGGGGSVGSYGSGVGLGIGIDLTPAPPEAIETRLALAIHPASGGSNLWEGRAQMSASANSAYAAPDAAAARMAAALLEGFPGTSGETIQIP